MPFRLSEQERALVMLWRAFMRYGNERDAAIRLLDDPADADEEAMWIEVHRDGSGQLTVDPASPNARRYAAATWGDLGAGPDTIDRATGEMARRRLRHNTRGTS